MTTKKLALSVTTLGLAMALGLTGCSGSHDTHASSTTSATDQAGDAAKQGDIMFAQMMIPHHEQAVQMADQALDTKHQASAEVKKLAEQIKATQGPEIQQMQGWLNQWGAPATADAHAGHSMEGMMTEEQMTSLDKAAGADFDKQWLTMMIAHHEGAVTMSQAVLKTTKNSEVIVLADSIIKGQKKEIDQMKKLLA